MGFWGWRQAAWVAFISVIVVACTEAAVVTPPPATPSPRPVTLTLQGSPGAPPVTPRPTLNAVAATPSEDDPAPVEIEPPVCAETLSDGYQCIGTARNNTGSMQGTVMIYAALYDGSEMVQQQTFALEQRLLSPDSDAPYRVLFDQSSGGRLVLSYSNAYAPDKQLVALDVRDEAGTSDDDGSYALSAVVVNPHRTAVKRIRVIASLYDGARFVGYRIAEIDALDADGVTEIVWRWYGLPEGDYHYTVKADAFTGR